MDGWMKKESRSKIDILSSSCLPLILFDAFPGKRERRHPTRQRMQGSILSAAGRANQFEGVSIIIRQPPVSLNISVFSRDLHL
jgi:hypothetical protein